MNDKRKRNETSISNTCIDNLSIGFVFKNYNELHCYFNLDHLSGNSRKAQLKEIERYIKIEKQGHKYTVVEIYNIPLPKENLNRTTYINIIEKLILDTLVQSDEYHISITSNTFMNKFKMVNVNYLECKKRKNKLALYSNIDELTINEFYDSTHKMLKRNVESTLNELKKKRLIDWYPKLMLCKIVKNIDPNIKRNVAIINGEENESHDIHVSLTYKHSPATIEERKLVLNLEYACCNEYGCENIQETVTKGVYHKFSNMMKDELVKHNIAYYYNTYDMVLNSEGLKERQKTVDKLLLGDILKCKHQLELNQEIINKVNSNTIKRHDRVKNISDNDIEKEIDRVRKNSQYIIDMIELSNMLLSHDYDNIINEVYKVDVNQLPVDDINSDNMFDYVMNANISNGSSK